MTIKPLTLIAVLLILLSGTACSEVPENAQPSGTPVSIFPDYDGAAIPWNIAPLNFRIEEDAKAWICAVRGADGKPLVAKGPSVRFPMKAWRNLLEANRGEEIKIDIYGKRGGKWSAYQTMTLFVAPDAVDRYLSYRLIEPTYGMAGEMCIAQRDLTSFSEKEIYNNQMDYDKLDGQCINCHSFQDWKTDRMQFHVRQKDGGTVIARNGHISKVNLKAEGFLSPGVYPSWHPTEDLIAYSLNSTRQYFYSKGIDKTEVIDSDSDLILYDPAENKASVVAADTSALETFPSWAPDGKTLYYVSADITALAPMRQYYYGPHYDELKYNLMRIPFDPATRTFGEKETFFDAATLDKSATFPRVSPDGRYLLFTMAGFGQFHIWHRDADLFLSDLATGEWRRLENVNSEETESYHCWSSDGRWIVFSSRRGDRTYTHLYLAWFDGEGHAHKPFLLPQRNPERHDGLFKSYNIPEFTKEPVTISPKRFLKAVKGEAIQAQR